LKTLSPGQVVAQIPRKSTADASLPPYMVTLNIN